MKKQLAYFDWDLKVTFGEPSVWGTLPHNVRNYKRKFGIIEIDV